MKRPIYLDNNATTPTDPRVVEAMIPFFTQKFGNASSADHRYGWEAEEAIEHAREQVATLVGATAKEIHFTSGATEAINIALQGVINADQHKKHHILTCITEHKVVLDCCSALKKQGNTVTFLGVSKSGRIDLGELEKNITERTKVVCIMLANNETGVLQQINEISKITRDKNVLLITDATQAVGKIPMDVELLGADIMAFSAHKLYGPKGVGALYVRKNSFTMMKAIQYGGNQERKIRPGTLNVPGIVGFGEACEICYQHMTEEKKRQQELRDHLEAGLLNKCDMEINGDLKNRLPNTSNITLNNIDGNRLMRNLRGIAASQGSACTSAVVEPSHVLRGLGLTDQQAFSSIRFSLGRFTTQEEIDETIEIVKNTYEGLRRRNSEGN